MGKLIFVFVCYTELSVFVSIESDQSIFTAPSSPLENICNFPTPTPSDNTKQIFRFVFGIWWDDAYEWMMMMMMPCDDVWCSAMRWPHFETSSPFGSINRPKYLILKSKCWSLKMNERRHRIDLWAPVLWPPTQRASVLYYVHRIIKAKLEETLRVDFIFGTIFMYMTYEMARWCSDNSPNIQRLQEGETISILNNCHFCLMGLCVVESCGIFFGASQFGATNHKGERAKAIRWNSRMQQPPLHQIDIWGIMYGFSVLFKYSVAFGKCCLMIFRQGGESELKTTSTTKTCLYRGNDPYIGVWRIIKGNSHKIHWQSAMPGELFIHISDRREISTNSILYIWSDC